MTIVHGNHRINKTIYLFSSVSGRGNHLTSNVPALDIGIVKKIDEEFQK